MKGQRPETAELRAEAVRLRTQGLSFRQIAEVQGVDVHTAHQRYTQALRDVPAEAVAEHRALDGERIDAMIVQLWGIAHDDHPYVSQGKVMEGIRDVGPNLAAMREIRGYLHERALLFGTHAPQRSVLNVITEDVLDAEIRRLEEQLGAAERIHEEA